MAEKTERTVRVRMRDGLVMPLPREIVRNSSTFICTPETPIEVLLDHRFTRNRIAAGDLVLVDEDPAALGLPEVRGEVGRSFPEAPYREPAPNTDVDLVSGTVRHPEAQPAEDPGLGKARSGLLGNLLHRDRKE